MGAWKVREPAPFSLIETMQDVEIQEALSQVPRFLEAIGRGGEKVAFTAYGGNGGNWHLRVLGDGSAGMVGVDRHTLAELAEHGRKAAEGAGHQLGFYCARPVDDFEGGSRTSQISEVPCLKVEFDTCSIEDQLRIYREFEKCYGVRFTLVETGGKSVHAYLRLDRAVAVDRYRMLCEAFHAKIEETAAGLDLYSQADENVARPAQTMRLPGAVHRKTGKVARVLQFGEVCSLENIKLDEAALSEHRKSSAKQVAIARISQEDLVLGYGGDEGLNLLRSAASVWPVRVVGEGTYGDVLPLIAAMNNALGADMAAQVLFYAGHNDCNGQHSQEGLWEWCASFHADPERSSQSKGFILGRAESRYGWKMPEVSSNSLQIKVTEPVETEDELRVKAPQGGGLYNPGTGFGKSQVIVVEHTSEVCLAAKMKRGDSTKLYATVCTPRRTINSQLARETNGVNVSDKENALKAGRLHNLLITCPQSLGNPKKAPIHNEFWGAQHVTGADGERYELGWGMNAAAIFVVDEIRQTLEMLALGKTGEDELFATPARRKECLMGLLTSMHRAVHCYAMDAQMGTVEQRLWKSLREGRPDADRVVGPSRPRAKDRTFRWTNSQSQWKSYLWQAVANQARTKPVLAIVASCGDVKSRGGKLSAHGLAGMLRERNHGLNVVVIKGDNKEEAAVQRVLSGDVEGVDVVIGSPAIQSGFSFINVFHPQVFVAGGATMPPNVTGGQAGRRERTATECIAYLPRYEFSTSLPFATADRKANEAQVRAEHERRGEPVNEVLLELQLDLAERMINELALFTETTLGYANLDGWNTEELPEIKPLSKVKAPVPAPKTDKKTVRWDSLGYIHQEFISCLLGLQSLTDLADKESQHVKGGMGADLVAANAPELVELLLRSGFVHLCDGQPRLKDDPMLLSCGLLLQSLEAQDILIKSGLLSWRKSRSEDPAGNACKVIGSLAKQLGGYGERCGKKRSKYVVCLPHPEGCP